MIRQRPVELLAPARNVECAMAAVDHGADAVYIGASRFGARASAGNSVEDIARVVEYAHTFRVKVYVTVNTILKDEELPETERLVWALYRAGVDALIVQDMALLELDLPPIPLHASTQMDNRTPEKVKFLHSLGSAKWCWRVNCLWPRFRPCMRLATCRWRSLYTGRSVSVTADSATCRSIASGGVPIGESAPSSAA